MRYLLMSMFLLLTACKGTDGTEERVAFGGFREPQLTYAREHVSDMDALGGSHYRLALYGEQPTVIVNAVQFFEPENAAAGVCLPPDCPVPVISIDPTRANGELAFTAVMLHELIHEKISRGRHPERAQFHVCQFDGPLCYADGWWDAHAVMLPTSPGLGTSTGSGWGGSTEIIDTGAIPNFVITQADKEFYQWATSEN